MPAGASRTVLVVDDDDSIRMVAEMAMEMVGGWEVLTADGGLAALAVVAERRPDVVLLDVMMPGMDGIETLRRLQADPATRDIPVVLVTAKARPAETPAWADLPVAGVIAKPFDPMSLSAQVEQLIGWA